MSTIYIPYTYLIGWSKLDKWYYGSETSSIKKIANPSNLFTKYFTSSKHVKNFIKNNGMPDIIQIRKTFKTKQAAIIWEQKVLQKIDAKNNPKFLNRTNNISNDYYSQRGNYKKGLEKALEKISGKTWEESLGPELALKRKEQNRISAKEKWSNAEFKETVINIMKQNRKGNEKYINAAKTRWSNSEFKAMMISNRSPRVNFSKTVCDICHKEITNMNFKKHYGSNSCLKNKK
jgi:hypothetical protein